MENSEENLHLDIVTIIFTVDTKLQPPYVA